MFTLSRAKENFRDNFCWFRARRKYFKGKIWKTRGVALLPMPSANICWSLFCFRRLKAKKVCFSGYVVLSTILSWNVKLLEGFSSSFPFSRSPLKPTAEERNYFPAWFHFKWFLGCFCRKKKTIFTSLMKKFSLSWFIWEVCSLLMFSLPWSEIV